MHACHATERNCQTCTTKQEGFLCYLPPDAAKEFDEIKSFFTYPTGSFLFLEKEPVRGIFMLCSGKAKLTISSRGGKTLILRLAKTGETLGLVASMSGSPYEATVEALEPCSVAFIRQDDFMRFIARHPKVYQTILRQLGAQYYGTCEQMRTIALSTSSREKLARLLLHWSCEGRETKEGTRISVPLTHEQIAECVGSTRETVTRTLSEFKHRHLVMLKGATMVIPDRAALAAIGGD
jgi:CRP/FNR family cyclic AMP-dependent transcriptional regulator